jgi:spermidine/putrescine transport system substrate-binding protein
MKRYGWMALLAASALALTACSGGGGADSASSGGEASKELNIYAWAGEVPDAVVAAFEKKTGVKVTIDTFDSNETMIAKLAAGGSGYDIIEPSQYAVQLLVGQKLLEKIDYDQVEGMDNLTEKFVNPGYDPDNAYSIPWVWGTTGLLYNQDCTGEEITSWSSMFDEKYKGKVYMLDNMLAAYIVGLQANGLPATSTDEDEIAKATQTLIDQKPMLAGYNSTNYYDLVASGDACIAEAWGGSSVAKVVGENPSVHYILPKEGGTIWTDSFSIAADAPHSDAAYKWLNFTLDPETAALATNEGSMATANAGAAEHITDEALLNNAAIFAPDDMLTNSEFIVDPGEAMTFYQDGWTRVKAS